MIIRDIDAVVDTRWMTFKTPEEINIMLNYLKVETYMILKAREFQENQRRKSPGND